MVNTSTMFYHVLSIPTGVWDVHQQRKHKTPGNDLRKPVLFTLTSMASWTQTFSAMPLSTYIEMMEFDGMLRSCASLIFVASNIFRLWGGLFCWAAATVQWGSRSDRGGTWVGEFEELQSRNELDVLGKCFDGFCCSQGGHLVLLGLSSQTKQFLEEWLWCKMLQVTFRASSGSNDFFVDSL